MPIAVTELRTCAFESYDRSEFEKAVEAYVAIKTISCLSKLSTLIGLSAKIIA